MTVARILRQIEALRRPRADAGRVRAPGVAPRCRVLTWVPPRAVPLADLRRLAAQLGPRQQRARALWDTGDRDARVLATLVVEPTAVEDADLDRWVETAGDAAMIDRVCLTVVVATPWARSKVADWAHHPQALARRAAYVVLRVLAREDAAMTDADFIPWVDAIPSAAPREAPVVRAAMLSALAGICARNETLRLRVARAMARLRPPAPAGVGVPGGMTLVATDRRDRRAAG